MRTFSLVSGYIDNIRSRNIENMEMIKNRSWRLSTATQTKKENTTNPYTKACVLPIDLNLPIRNSLERIVWGGGDYQVVTYSKTENWHPADQTFI